MSQMALATRPAEISLADLLCLKSGADRTTVLGVKVRSDEAANLLSVKDLIVAIVGCNQSAAERKIAKLKADGYINTEGANTEFEYFMDGSYRVLGAPIDTFAGLCAHLKGDLALQIHRRSITNSCRLDAGDKSLIGYINTQAEVVDRAAAQGSVLAIALKQTRVPYVETGVHKIAADRLARGNNTALLLHEVYDDCGESGDAIKIITNVLNVAVRYHSEMIDMKAISDSVKTDDKYTFLRDATFPVTFYEHANQCVYGFTCSTKQFKDENNLPAHKQLCCFMNREQLQLVIQFVKRFLNNLLRDHKAGENITRAHVKSVSQEVRNHVFVASQELGLDQLEMDEMDNACDINKQENRNLAIMNRLGKSEQILQKMPEDTDAQKKLKEVRSGKICKRITKTAAKFATKTRL